MKSKTPGINCPGVFCCMHGMRRIEKDSGNSLDHCGDKSLLSTVGTMFCIYSAFLIYDRADR